jgi:hypothetical protein
MKRALRVGLGLLAPLCARADTGAGAAGRVDALVDTQQQNGVVVVQGSGSSGWINAEAYVWGAAYPTGSQPLAADALVFAMTMRDPHGVAELRLGRFLFESGAIRPVQLDGGSVIVRSPWGTKVEAMTGAPVIPGYGPHDFDWIVGGRLSQIVASRMIVGVSYVERWHAGDVADQEVGTDLTVKPTRWLDVAARASYDIESPGISEALVSAAARAGDVRIEVFATHRSPSRLLPDTSLFSIFGDFPSENVGSVLYWKAAPRLDVWLMGEGQYVGGVYGGNGFARARLKLDDRNDGSVSLEVRRQDASTAQWTGLRATATKRIVRTLRASTELELVIPDQQTTLTKGAAWPWGLLSLGWRPCKRWELAGGVEMASTPEHLFETNILGRFSLFWESK